MFKVDEEKDLSFLSADITTTEKNYTIQPNDRLRLRVYTNKGERIIDPNNELQYQQNQNREREEKPDFVILKDGSVVLPMVGSVTLQGMTIDIAEKYLAEKYSEYYKEAFVKLEFLNKRVIVLGAPGGQVINLENENISILEVVALAGGIDENGKAGNLRLIRGDLHNPQVYQINLSTLEGMRTSMMDAEPGDVLYIEPKVKVVTEGARDFMTIFAIFVNAVTLVALIISLNK